TSRRVRERSPAPQAVGELWVRPRSAGGGRASGAHQGVPCAARRLDRRRALRALLFQREAAMRAVGRTGGRAVGTGVLLAAVLTAGPPVRLTAQDSSAVDRGVRIGIVYRPGVRPGMVV